MSEALSYHMEEGTKLKKAKARLEEENETLRQEKEMNDMMIQEKVQQSRHQKDAIKKVSDNVGHGRIKRLLYMFAIGGKKDHA